MYRWGKRSAGAAAIAAVGFLCLLVAPLPASAAELEVTTCADENDGCGVGECSLREAIAVANADAAADSIVFADPLADCADAEIDLTGGGTLAITTDVTITGPGSGALAVDGQAAKRVLDVAAGAVVTVSGLTIRNGRTPGSGDHGAGIRNEGDLTLVDVVVKENRAYSGSDFDQFPGASGGGIYNGAGGTLRLEDSLVSDNYAGDAGSSGNITPNEAGDGGGLYTLGPLELVRTTVTRNFAGNGSWIGGIGGEGGGIFVATGATLLARDSTISANRSGDGGPPPPVCCASPGPDGTAAGVRVLGSAQLVNSTLSGNVTGRTAQGNAAFGGGISVGSGSTGGVLRLENVTITSNVAEGLGGGLRRVRGTVTLRSSLLADNTAPGGSPDCSSGSGAGAVTSEGGNVVGVIDGCPAPSGGDDLFGTSGSPLDPLLGPLADNGGLTLTHLPAVGSPALDAEGPAGCSWLADFGAGPETPLTADQRGEPRPADGDFDGTSLCDAGAVEVPPPDFSVDVVVTGFGTVSSDPAGIDCGGACSADFPGGSTVDLTATPDLDNLFVGWAGSCAGTDPADCSFVVDGDEDVTATFAEAVDLTVDATGTGGASGTVTGPGVDCGVDCTETFAAGDPVTLSAAPGAASAFDAWSGPCAGKPNPCTFSILADATVTATFVPGPLLTVSVSGTGSGEVTGAGVDCGADCTERYTQGEAVQLLATADPGSFFDSWTGDCAGSGATCDLTMDGDRTTAAVFLPNPALTVSVAGTGSGTVTGPGIDCGGDCAESYDPGTAVQLLATADPGSFFDSWTGDCAGPDPTCDLTMSADRTATATFVPAVELTVAVAGSGTVTGPAFGIDCPGTCQAVHPAGTTGTLTATPEPGAVFYGWRAGACTPASDPACDVTLTADVAVEAVFGPPPFFADGFESGDTGSWSSRVP